MSTNPYEPSSAVSAPASPRAQASSPVWAIARSVLGVVGGVLAGGIVVALIEIPGTVLHPLPPGVDMADAEVLKAHFARAPLGALIGIAIAWSVGPLVGSWVAASIARWAFFAHGVIIGGIFVAFDVMNIRSFPHPTWLAVVGVLGPLVMSWLGSSLAEWLLAPRSPDPKPYDMRKKNMAC